MEVGNSVDSSTYKWVCEGGNIHGRVGTGHIIKVDLLKSLGFIYSGTQRFWEIWIKRGTSRWRLPARRKKVLSRLETREGLYGCSDQDTSEKYLDSKIDEACILIGRGWKVAGKPLKVISEVLFFRTWSMVCHRHNGKMLLKRSGFFSSFTQHICTRSNIDWNYSDFIQFHSLSTCYFVQLMENENIPDSKLITYILM